jgi:hypothetical protein
MRPKITGIKADPTQKEEFDADFDFGQSKGKFITCCCLFVPFVFFYWVECNNAV